MTRRDPARPEMPIPGVGDWYIRQCRGHFHVCQFFGVPEYEGDGSHCATFEMASILVLRKQGRA